MTTFSTLHLRAIESDLDRAAQLLRGGDLVAFPTETVYGLGADARNGTAVANIYAAKGRPSFNPLIVHVPDVASAKKYVVWNDTAQLLADHFWPGALTIVLPLRAGHGLSSLVTAGLDTLAIRVPKHTTAQRLLHLADTPIAAPSANPSGRISPTTAQHVLDGLAGKIAAVVDDGPCGVGLESTILGVTPNVTVLRHGGVTAEQIEAVLGIAVPHSAPSKITAPGQMNSHYAPNAAVRLDVIEAKTDEVLLGFGPMECDLNLSKSGDLIEAAANLFDHLHRLDKTGKPIAIAPIPQVGLGRAINDRLRRAAAPR
ncbi:MAG: L-threonylcarbamoyladenylate synthase [Ascidiaceihabitans sp.]|jgi:L-threonylcarbamoyladenylate synthase